MIVAPPRFSHRRVASPLSRPSHLALAARSRPLGAASAPRVVRSRPTPLSLGAATRVVAPRPRWRQDVDTRSKTTQGNARFCMELLRDNYCYPGATVRLILVTSDFHMARARMIFHRAAEAILRPAGHSWYVECRCSKTPDNAAGHKYREAAGRLEDGQRKSLLERRESDAEVEKWL